MTNNRKDKLNLLYQNNGSHCLSLTPFLSEQIKFAIISSVSFQYLCILYGNNKDTQSKYLLKKEAL